MAGPIASLAFGKSFSTAEAMRCAVECRSTRSPSGLSIGSRVSLPDSWMGVRKSTTLPFRVAAIPCLNPSLYWLPRSAPMVTPSGASKDRPSISSFTFSDVTVIGIGKVVGDRGLEPLTPCMSSRYSSQLS